MSTATSGLHKVQWATTNIGPESGTQVIIPGFDRLSQRMLAHSLCALHDVMSLNLAATRQLLLPSLSQMMYR